MLKKAASLVSIGCVIVLVACVGDASDEVEAGASQGQERSGLGASESDLPAAEDTDQAESAALAGLQAGAVTNEEAIKGIVSARCAREAHCKNIGPDKDYADKGACEKKIGAEVSDEISATEYPSGISKKELNNCVQSIQKEECNNPVKKLARVLACRSHEQCESK